MDRTKIQLAQQEAEHEAITNVKFLVLDIDHLDDKAEYDLVYARLLTHPTRARSGQTPCNAWSMPLSPAV